MTFILPSVYNKTDCHSLRFIDNFIHWVKLDALQQSMVINDIVRHLLPHVQQNHDLVTGAITTRLCSNLVGVLAGLHQFLYPVTIHLARY